MVGTGVNGIHLSLSGGPGASPDDRAAARQQLALDAHHPVAANVVRQGDTILVQADLEIPPTGAAVETSGDAAGGADPHGVVVGQHIEGPVQQVLFRQTVGAGQSRLDQARIRTGLRQAVGEDEETVGRVLTTAVDDLVSAVGKDALPAAAPVP